MTAYAEAYYVEDYYTDTSADGSDTTAPTLSSTTPADDATGVAVTVNPTATFSESIAFGTGNITLRDVTAGTNVEVFDVTVDVGGGAGTVSISTDTLTIEPTSDLSNSNEYAIRIDSTAIEDTAGNAYAGISDDTTWSWTTAAASDTTAPTFDAGPAAANIGQTSHDIQATLNEAGTIYAVTLANGATAPTSAEVKAGTGSGGATPVSSGSTAASAGVQASIGLTGQTADTAYDDYVVAEDDETTPNLQASPTLVNVTTAAANTGYITGEIDIVPVADGLPDIVPSLLGSPEVEEVISGGVDIEPH